MIFDNSIIVLFFQILFFAIMFVYYNKKKSIGLSTVLLGVYLFVAINSAILFIDPYSKQFFSSLNFFPIIYFSFVFYVFSYPILRLNERRIQSISTINNFYIYSFSVFIILVYFISGIDVIRNFNQLVINLLSDSQFGKELYEDSRAITDDRTISYIGVFSASLRDFPQFLLFYILTFKNKNKKIIFGLIFAVIVSVLSGLSQGLRGHAIFLLMSSVFCFILFKRFYTKKVLRFIKITSFTIFISVSIIFIFISKSRFDTGYSRLHNSQYATLMYSGQSLLYFNNYAFDNNGLRNGDRVANLFKSFIWEDTPKNQEERKLKYKNLRISDEVFSTFLGEFVFDFGPVGTFFIFVLFSIFAIRRTRVKTEISMRQIILLYFIWNTLLFGVFLFPYSDFSGNLRIVTLVLFSLIVVKKQARIKNINYA